MTGKLKRITKQKGVILIADLLFTGAERKVIVQKFTNAYGLSVSAVDKWIKCAHVIVNKRMEEEEEAKRAAMKETNDEMVKRLGLEKENVLSELKKIAFFDIRKVYTVDGGLKNITDLDEESAGALAGVESYDEKLQGGEETIGTTSKVKVWDKRAALDSICKILGYNAPDKIAPTDAEGNNVASLPTSDLLTLAKLQAKIQQK